MVDSNNKYGDKGHPIPSVPKKIRRSSKNPKDPVFSLNKMDREFPQEEITPVHQKKNINKHDFGISYPFPVTWSLSLRKSCVLACFPNPQPPYAQTPKIWQALLFKYFFRLALINSLQAVQPAITKRNAVLCCAEKSNKSDTHIL